MREDLFCVTDEYQAGMGDDSSNGVYCADCKF